MDWRRVVLAVFMTAAAVCFEILSAAMFGDLNHITGSWVSGVVIFFLAIFTAIFIAAATPEEMLEDCFGKRELLFPPSQSNQRHHKRRGCHPGYRKDGREKRFCRQGLGCAIPYEPQRNHDPDNPAHMARVQSSWKGCLVHEVQPLHHKDGSLCGGEYCEG